LGGILVTLGPVRRAGDRDELRTGQIVGELAPLLVVPARRAGTPRVGERHDVVDVYFGRVGEGEVVVDAEPLAAHHVAAVEPHVAAVPLEHRVADVAVRAGAVPVREALAAVAAHRARLTDRELLQLPFRLARGRRAGGGVGFGVGIGWGGAARETAERHRRGDRGEQAA